MEDTKNNIELLIVEGETIEQSTNEGELMKDVQMQEEPIKDTDLLRNINQKLDLLLAAQNIN